MVSTGQRKRYGVLEVGGAGGKAVPTVAAPNEIPPEGAAVRAAEEVQVEAHTAT